MWLASVALAAAGAVDASHHASALAGGSLLTLIIAVSAVATAGIGAVVAGKTGNLVGWLLAGGGVALSAGLSGMVSSGTACGPDNSSATWLAVVSIGGPVVWWACLTTSLALFPSGQVGRRRTAALLLAGPVLAWTGAAVAAVGASTRPGASVRDLGLGNCAGGGIPRAQTAGVAVLVAGYFITVGLMLLRVPRLKGRERPQLLPVAITAAAVGLLLAAAAVIEPWARPFSGDAPWVVASWVVAGLAIPLAVTVSVIRYHTFGIHRFIDYLSDYRLWTVGSAALGVVAATGLGWGAAALVGLSRQPIAVALATLGAAAAAFPFWRHGQAVVDARYGQRQRDPAVVLEALAHGTSGGSDGALRGPIFDLLERFAPIVIVEGDSGMRFAVRTDDREIGRHTFVNGAYDLKTMRFAMELLEAELGRGPTPLAGRTVLDVGANIGISIVPLLKLFGAERGIAVEPAPDHVEMLRLNLALNGLVERVQVVPVGLSDRDGTLELALSAENFGDHRLRVPGTGPVEDAEARRTVMVQVRRLDSLVENGELDASSLGLIWLDVQGHEGHVLAGARTLLASRIPVLTEFWPSTMKRAGGLNLFLEAVRSCFTRVVDVRLAESAGHPETLPSSRIDEVVERYVGSAAFTDLLLLP
jgi:FkbM family methyltransferase